MFFYIICGSIAIQLILLTAIHFYKKFFLKNYYFNKPLRYGGILIFINLIVMNFYYREVLIFNDIKILNYVFLIITLILIEDTFQNIKPSIRFFFILLISFIFLFNAEFLPTIDMPLFRNLFNNFYIKLLIFTLAITTIVNGSNFIDGKNGLCTLMSIFVTLSLIIVVRYTGEEIILLNSLYLFFITQFIFLFLNFPKPMIYLGDNGSYILGFINISLTLYIFSFYYLDYTWLIIVILFYPLFEVIFSLLRRVVCFNSPFKADKKHLHHYIDNYLKLRFRKHSNNLTTIFLASIFATPSIFTYLIFLDVVSIFLSMILLIAIYLTYYIFFSRAAQTKQKNANS